MEQLKQQIHQLVEEAEDETKLIFCLYVANQLLAGRQ